MLPTVYSVCLSTVLASEPIRDVLVDLIMRKPAELSDTTPPAATQPATHIINGYSGYTARNWYATVNPLLETSQSIEYYPPPAATACYPYY